MKQAIESMEKGRTKDEQMNLNLNKRDGPVPLQSGQFADKESLDLNEL